MAALIPAIQTSNVEATYEDMFKEITRKLYGEETGNGLHTLGTPVAHVATSGPTAPEGERSFTTLMSDRSIAQTIEYDHNSAANETSTVGGSYKTEDHLTTAFGLATLMQNGFATNGTILNSHIIPKASTNVSTTVTSTVTGNSTNNSTTNSNTNNDIHEQRWNGQNNEIQNWTNNGKLAAFNISQKSNKISKNNRDQLTNHLYSNNNTNLQTNNNNNINRKNKNSSNQQNSTGNNNQIQQQKRYSCSHCPYSTDRRDLYTRHENIHKDEKPFQCYACLKQFNRADHVKKHFLRMHRELAYDINKTRRCVNTDQKSTIFVQSTNAQPQQQQQQHNVPENFLVPQRINPTPVHDTSLSIAQTIESVATAQVSQQQPLQMKQEKSQDEKLPAKIKREKRFSCCYCPWCGADKWGLKRHLNTHTKPFVCMLCDYKAARSERLATHVLKVHNKRACNKCSFLADNQDEFQTHISEMHPHEHRPARNSNNNNNVLRTIGNSLITNSQINNFQTSSTSFGNVQATNNNVAIYSTNDLTNNANGNVPNALQEIIVNPQTMVGWRLSANGSLIAPHGSTGLNDTTISLNSTQKRGAERLFQYLEADGSDPEDYARQIKMDAISRNTSSVAQDFHNAGGVGTTSKHLPNHSNYVENHFYQGETSNKTNSNTLIMLLQKEKAMSISLAEKIIEQQFFKTPPAYINPYKLTETKKNRLSDKENSNSIFNKYFAKIGVQLQNYPMDTIDKHKSETSLLYLESEINQQFNDSEKYIEYLKGKRDITLSLATNTPETSKFSTKPIIRQEKRNRKQIQPKRIPKKFDIITFLRDKYLKRYVEKKISCTVCTSAYRKQMLVLPYHSKSSLALHRLWRHANLAAKCNLCEKVFNKKYSLIIHLKMKHGTSKC